MNEELAYKNGYLLDLQKVEPSEVHDAFLKSVIDTTDLENVIDKCLIEVQKKLQKKNLRKSLDIASKTLYTNQVLTKKNLFLTFTAIQLVREKVKFNMIALYNVYNKKIKIDIGMVILNWEIDWSLTSLFVCPDIFKIIFN